MVKDISFAPFISCLLFLGSFLCYLLRITEGNGIPVLYAIHKHPHICPEIIGEQSGGWIGMLRAKGVGTHPSY